LGRVTDKDLVLVRVDQWLCAARLYKSRTQARDACLGGHVKLNGVAVKPSQDVKVGDEVHAVAPRGQFVGKVLAVAAKRLSPPLARELYEDHSPPPPPKEERMPRRDRGAGRPTKHERRALERFRGEDD
jgi:ribosome-associated heat shock protein Hsp15